MRRRIMGPGASDRAAQRLGPIRRRQNHHHLLARMPLLERAGS
jgi:hypothetical protein